MRENPKPYGSYAHLLQGEMITVPTKGTKAVGLMAISALTTLLFVLVLAWMI